MKLKQLSRAQRWLSAIEQDCSRLESRVQPCKTSAKQVSRSQAILLHYTAQHMVAVAAPWPSGQWIMSVHACLCTCMACGYHTGERLVAWTCLCSSIHKLRCAQLYQCQSWQLSGSYLHLLGMLALCIEVIFHAPALHVSLSHKS